MIFRKIKSAFLILRPSKIFQRFDQKLSRAKLGNGAGYTNHLQGERDIASALSWDGEMTQSAKIMRKEGFSEISSYDQELMTRIRSDWNLTINDDSKCSWEGPLSRRIKFPELNIPIIKELINEDVLNHFRAYYGTEVKIITALCWRIFDPKENKGKHVYSNW